MDEYEERGAVNGQRQKGKKNKRSKEFRAFATSGAVTKYVVDQHPVIIRGRQHYFNKDSEPDPFDIDLNVNYSLNKKNRWQLAEAIVSRLPELNDREDHAKVSAIEKVFLRSQIHHTNRPLTTAYHSLDEDGIYKCRRPKHLVAQEKTLTEKPRLPKKQRKTVEENVATTPSDNNGDLHIRYEITSAHPSRKCFRLMQNYVTATEKANMARMKKSVKRQQLSNKHDDELLDMDEDFADDDYEQWNSAETSEEYIPPGMTAEHQLLDFVKVKQEKQKKSDRFEMVELESVLSLDSDSDTELLSGHTAPKRLIEIPPTAADLFVTLTVPLKSERAICGDLDRDDTEEEHCWDLTDDFPLSNDDHTATAVSSQSSELRILPFMMRGRREGGGQYRCLRVPSTPVRYLLDLSEHIVGNSGAQAKKVLLTLERRCANKIRMTLNGDFAVNAAPAEVQTGIKSFYRPPHTLEGAINAVVLYLDQQLCNPASRGSNNGIASHIPLANRDIFYVRSPKSLAASTEVIQESTLTRLAAEHHHADFNDFDDITEIDPARAMVCGICYNGGDRLAMQTCGRSFCVECWRAYCTRRVRVVAVPITCPEMNCNHVVPLLMLMSMLPVKLHRLYEKLLLEQFMLEKARSYAFCPGCTNVIAILKPSEFHVLSCSACNISWCQQCQYTAHWPLTCAEAASYSVRFEQQRGLERFFLWQSTGERETSVRVKTCPRCHLTMQKDGGCNVLHCRCGANFCWSCLHVFDGTNNLVHSCRLISGNMVELKDVKKIDLNNKMAKEYFIKCDEYRSRRADAGIESNLRNSLRRMNATAEERAAVIAVRIEALYLLEYGSVWLYMHERGNGDIREQCKRVATIEEYMEQCCFQQQSHDSLRPILDDCIGATKKLTRLLRNRSTTAYI